jgi:4-hydroxy-2-oxoheptanedioate aldolase
LLGTFLIELPALRTVRVLALAGFDFVVLDLEHSPFGTETLHSLVAECQAAGIPPLVRVWTSDPGLIGKVLDIGVAGVMIPRVSSAAEAREVVQAARYDPRGDRGMAPLISYSASPDPQSVVGNSPLVIVQLESRQAIDEAAAIMAVPGLDMVFVGPYDLSQALGQPGNVDSDEVHRVAERIAAAAPANIMLGVYVDNPAWSRDWVDRGFRFQCVGFDGRMLLQGARTTLMQARNENGQNRAI